MINLNQDPVVQSEIENDLSLFSPQSLPENAPGYGDPEEAFENMLHGKALLADFDKYCKELQQ
jgi:hypothetical protein